MRRRRPCSARAPGRRPLDSPRRRCIPAPGSRLHRNCGRRTAKLVQAVHLDAAPGGAAMPPVTPLSTRRARCEITVDIHDGGRRISQGSGNPTVANQFGTKPSPAERQIRAANYHALRTADRALDLHRRRAFFPLALFQRPDRQGDLQQAAAHRLQRLLREDQHHLVDRRQAHDHRAPTRR